MKDHQNTIPARQFTSRPSRRALLAAVAGGAALAVSGAGTASAGTARDPDRCPALLTGHGATTHPEGASWDPVHGRFVVGSLLHGTVSTLGPDGVVRLLVDDPAVLVATTGIQVDPARRRVLVCNAAPGAAERTTPATKRRVAGLGCYDLRTGRRLWYTDLAAVAADGGEHFGNDVALDVDGTAYVTDSLAPIVYRVGLDGRAAVFAQDARLGDPSGDTALNGIVRQGRVLLLGHDSHGSLWRLPLDRPADLAQVAVSGSGTLVGLDGLRARDRHTVLGVTNQLIGDLDQLVELRSTDDWHTATQQITPSRDLAPTAVTHGPDGAHYVLSGRLDLLFNGTPSDTFTLRRWPRQPLERRSSGWQNGRQ